MKAGDTLGRWTLIRLEVRGWVCRCACGTEKKVAVASLVRGASKSCGCLRSELVTKSNTTHGGSKTRLYRVWAAMWDRCTNPNDREFHNYGGRGIKVCAAWRDFEKFRRDMGEPGVPGLMLERKKVNKGYSKGNCTWATPSQQARNRQNSMMLTAWGKTKSVHDWADELGVPASRLKTRVNRQGLSHEEALSRPSRYKD